MLDSDTSECFVRKNDIYPQHKVFTKMFIKSYTNKYNNLVFRQKSIDLYVENGILQKLRDCFLNISCMLNILLTNLNAI